MKLFDRIKLCIRIIRWKPCNLMAHANRELLPPDGDEMQELMNQQLRESVLVFSTHGHSGFSASYARQSLDLLLNYKPLRPLTGEDSEWVEVSAGLFQNNRCGRVFKENGEAYDIDGKVFRDATGCFTSKDSRVPVTFPYTPTTVYVDVS